MAELHSADLRIKRERVAEEYEKKVQEVRDKMIKERDEALDKERERT